MSPVARSVDDNPSSSVQRPARAVLCRMRTCIRRLGLEHNDLHRRSDRVETGARIVVLLTTVLAVPMAVVLGMLVLDHLRATAATRHAVVATVVDQPRPLALPGRSVPAATAPVAWSSPGHDRHVGRTTVPAAADAGDRVTIWVTDEGELTSPPMTARDATAVAALTGSSVFLSALGVLASLFAGARRLLDRGRYRDWDVAWARFDAARRP